jgi:hypothetical protein
MNIFKGQPGAFGFDIEKLVDDTSGHEYDRPC